MGYLILQDRVLAWNGIWDLRLLLLAAPFIFGAVYQHQVFAILFWLLLCLGSTDLIMGMDQAGPGGSYWGGFLVLLLAGLSGSIGWGISTLVRFEPKRVPNQGVKLR